MKTKAHLLVYGKVQGVFYRASAQQEAHRLGLRGWIRNLPSGEVESEVEGEEAEVEEFVAWCRQGPPRSLVSQVTVDRTPYQGSYSTFQII
jgi:acylphosphatase